MILEQVHELIDTKLPKKTIICHNVFRISTLCLPMRLELRMQQVLPRLEFVNQCWLWSERMTSEAQKTIYCGSRSPPFLLTMIVGMHFNWGTVFSSDNGGVFLLRQILAFFIGIDDATRKHFVLRNNITIRNLISSIRLLLVFLKIPHKLLYIVEWLMHTPLPYSWHTLVSRKVKCRSTRLNKRPINIQAKHIFTTKGPCLVPIFFPTHESYYRPCRSQTYTSSVYMLWCMLCETTLLLSFLVHALDIERIQENM